MRESVFSIQLGRVGFARIERFFNPNGVLNHQNMLFCVDGADYAHKSGFHNQEKHENQHLHVFRH
jgi:hypothetical protein